MTDSNLSTRYDPKQVEEKWYALWEEGGLFRPEFRPANKTYCITIPPPNVTGSLHMGHALCYSVQDVLGRWKRMQGYEVLILPGTDHAGIATHKVVEQQLKAEGLTRYDLGREKFVERVWKWKEESGGTILRQFKRLGFAFDWSRERFTMDDRYHDAVLRVFIEWFEKGLIYRGKRVINWDPGLRTGVSDLEMNDELRRGKLYHIRYPFSDGSGSVVIATTRPETMLADVAVAVSPSDERYHGLVGKRLTLPLVGRDIPLISDEYPDPTFGTGAVKITPAHDSNDFEVGKRMGLDFNNPEEVPVCIGEDARIIAPKTKYHGMDRFDARKSIVEDLEAAGYIEKIEDYDVALKVSDRSGQVIEPLLSEQWFCSMKPLARQAIEVVTDGRIRFTPSRYKDVYLRWMEDIRDWCLSRQLWWGHRIPVYYDAAGTPYAAMTMAEAEKKAGGAVTQDPDVLDTWFSSALWPFATLGWPDDSTDLDKYYPTDVLVTARDIIYLWVARMIMDGMDQMKAVPFHDVYIYATVLTESGQRMSKSLGTGIDPIEFIDQFGADAMRFSLLVQTGHNQEIRFGEKRIEDARNFCNKIWNASRFALMNLEASTENWDLPHRDGLLLEDRWILSRLAACSSEVDAGLTDYNLMASCEALHRFFWFEFCDWYIEIAKERLGKGDRAPQAIVRYVLDAFCRLMHPFMPHITEEIWHLLPGVDQNAFLDYSEWPNSLEHLVDEDAGRRMETTLDVVRVARNLRQECGAGPREVLPALYVEGAGEGLNLEIVRSQARFVELKQGRPQGAAATAISTASGATLHLPLEGLVDPAKEIERLTREIEKAQTELDGLMARLNNPQFTQRAKPEIVQRDRDSAREVGEKISALVEKRNSFEKSE
jgi:valyl-tRNA synthetase